MPSPFPGMDPYLEGWEWESFHAAFIVDLGDAIAPLVRPKYIARWQQRVYVEHPSAGEDEPRIANGAVFESSARQDTDVGPAAGTVSAGASPVEVLLPMPEQRIETYLTVRERETLEVVTVVELLSPSNKRAGDGRREYLEKREEILQSRTNLVELDLLRGGRRLPTKTPLPPGDYYALISRAGRRPRADVYSWTLRDPLPVIPVPLRPDDADVNVALQPLFETRYDRAGYRDTLDYDAPLEPPPLSDEDAEWIASLMKSMRQ